jgi:hypothetical protein
MKRMDSVIIWGVVLVIAGILLLLQTFNVINDEGTIWAGIWAVIFGAGGIAFLWRFFADSASSWWAAIPGMAMSAIGVLLAVTALDLPVPDPWLGSLFLGALGLSFWLVYYVRREFWWAVIPGGALLTLAVVAMVTDPAEGEMGGAIFFFGLAITFGLLYFLPSERRMTWALIPAVITAVLGAAVLMSYSFAFNYIWGILLILAGIYLLYRQYGQGGHGDIARRS